MCRYTQQPELHIILALRWHDGTGIALGGGITFEYYPSTNCGLLTYLIVHRSSRGQGLASVLVERAVHLLQQTARRRGHLAGCNAILLETNSAGIYLRILVIFDGLTIRSREGNCPTRCHGSSYETHHLP